MDIKALPDKLLGIFKKYKYVCIVVLVGILLMTLPVGTKAKEEKETPTISVEKPDMETRLISILGQIQGAGKVSVMLTEAAGEETVFQTDQNVSMSENNSTTQKDTVIVTDKDRGENGLVVQKNPPRYQGAVVVCQGADNASVRLAITEAVASLTGLGTNCITIVKMK